MIYTCGSHNVVPGLGEMASPGHLLEIQVVRPHREPTGSTTRGGVQQSIF